MWAPVFVFGTTVLASVIDSSAAARNRPHIIFVVADDLGWNDVGWHNRLIHTPHLEQLALEGVILNQSYVQPVCTPSRTSFMTGYYPYHVGRQNHILHPLLPTGVPLRFPFLPEGLREAGYSTHMVGKWHLGYCNWTYTPTYRGFDSFFGFYNGALEYFSHTRSAVERSATSKWNLPEMDIGFDLRNNTVPSKRYNGVYSTINLGDGPSTDSADLRNKGSCSDHLIQQTLFARAAINILSSSSPADPLFLYLSFQAVHSPLQVPKVFEDLYSHIRDDKRRKYSGMVTAMDDAVGDVVEALKRFGFWDNTVFIFTTDNGGQTAAGGNNWPLRGNKGTLWEGGTRAVTFVHGSRLKKTGYVNNKLFHAVDWFPTILHLAGAKPVAGLDGINQWRTITSDVTGAREEFVYNIYESDPPRGAIRFGDYKLIRGFPGNPSGWMAPTTDLHFELENVYCHVKKNRTLRKNTQEFRLYNLAEDPLERHNLADSMPDLLTRLVNLLEQKTATMVPADDPSINPLGDPTHWGGVFSPGWCLAK